MTNGDSKAAHYQLINELYARKNSILRDTGEVDLELAGGSGYRSIRERSMLISRKYQLLDQLRETNSKIHQAKQERARHAAPGMRHPVTDHALVRWLERKHGLDMSSLREQLLTPEIREALKDPTQTYWSDGELVYILGNGAVVTVIPVSEHSTARISRPEDAGPADPQ